MKFVIAFAALGLLAACDRSESGSLAATASELEIFPTSCLSLDSGADPYYSLWIEPFRHVSVQRIKIEMRLGPSDDGRWLSFRRDAQGELVDGIGTVQFVDGKLEIVKLEDGTLSGTMSFDDDVGIRLKCRYRDDVDPVAGVSN